MAIPVFTGGTDAFVRRGMSSLTGVYNTNTFPSETIVSGTDEAIYPLTLGQAKKMLPVNTDLHDDFIQLLLEATTDQVERYIGRDTFRKERTSRYERPARVVGLPYGPHGNVTSVKSVTYDNIETTLVAGSDYYVHGIEFKTIELMAGTDQYLLVTYESGYQAGGCPRAIVGGIMQELSLQFKNRQDPNAGGIAVVNNLSLEARNLLMPFVRYVI